jgi:hypothetical protein
MPAPASTVSSQKPIRDSNELFVALLPSIRRRATVAARRLPVWTRREFVLDVIAAAYLLYSRLASRKLTALAFSTPLATYAVAHVRAGRCVGSRFSSRDVMSLHAQRRHAFRVAPLEATVDRFGRSWRETLVDKGSYSPGDAAAFRLDFGTWLKRLSARDRALVRVLADGESTSAAASRFGVSDARISQIRRELKRDWDVFQSDGRSKN